MCRYASGGVLILRVADSEEWGIAGELDHGGVLPVGSKGGCLAGPDARVIRAALHRLVTV